MKNNIDKLINITEDSIYVIEEIVKVNNELDSLRTLAFELVHTTDKESLDLCLKKSNTQLPFVHICGLSPEESLSILENYKKILIKRKKLLTKGIKHTFS
jgi:hypothetical protein|tara:strand:- start:65 stop:364 length:300 start_codon:yes stop_codon:yes gene_type:complete